MYFSVCLFVLGWLKKEKSTSGLLQYLNGHWMALTNYGNSLKSKTTPSLGRGVRLCHVFEFF